MAVFGGIVSTDTVRCTIGMWRKWQDTTFPAPLRIDRVQEVHDIAHDVLVVENGLLHADEFLQQHGVVHADFVIPLLQLLKLLLRRYKLGIEEIHLLSRNNVVRHDVGLSRGRCLSSDVVESILIVHLEIRVFELPGLSKSAKCRVKR